MGLLGAFVTQLRHLYWMVFIISHVFHIFSVCGRYYLEDSGDAGAQSVDVDATGCGFALEDMEY